MQRQHTSDGSSSGKELESEGRRRVTVGAVSKESYNLIWCGWDTQRYLLFVTYHLLPITLCLLLILTYYPLSVINHSYSPLLASTYHHPLIITGGNRLLAVAIITLLPLLWLTLPLP